MGLTMKIKFSGIFTVIFVISASKYVSTRNFNKIEGMHFSELHPKLWLCGDR